MAKVPQAHLNARRKSILDAATKIFSEKGTSGATMADIAREAGISPGAIYRYYDCKDALLQECLHSGATEAAERFRAAASSENPQAAFDDLSRAAFLEIMDEASHDSFVLALEHALTAAREADTPLRSTHQQEFRTLVGGVGDALAEVLRGVEIPGVEPHRLAEALVYMFYGAMMVRLRDGTTDVMPPVEAVIALMDHVTRESNSAARP